MGDQKQHRQSGGNDANFLFQNEKRHLNHGIHPENHAIPPRSRPFYTCYLCRLLSSINEIIQRINLICLLRLIYWSSLPTKCECLMLIFY